MKAILVPACTPALKEECVRGLPICDRQKVVYAAAAAIPKSVNKACMPIRSFS